MEQTQQNSITAIHNIEQWREANKDSFVPPICNKLMHKNQLSIMFVGGPNTRTDFHIEEGSEFFYQIKGNIQLPTVQNGQRKLVNIREGNMFLLPPRIPHSPQRPEPGSFGLVIERCRQEGEFDALRWYTDFEKCENTLWEKHFVCRDLGRDLVPVVQEFRSSPSATAGEPMAPLSPDQVKIHTDNQTVVPDPVVFADFLDQHKDTLARGGSVNVFGDSHPDKETRVLVVGGGADAVQTTHVGETWLYQHTGDVTVTTHDAQGQTITLPQGSCCVVAANVPYSVVRPEGSVGLVVTQTKYTAN